MDETIQAETPPARWAAVEIMGHRRHVGRIQEVEQFGTKMIRIDVPGEGDAWEATHFYGGASIFGFFEMTEEAARRECDKARKWGRPTLYELPAPEGNAPDLDDDGITF